MRSSSATGSACGARRAKGGALRSTARKPRKAFTKSEVNNFFRKKHQDLFLNTPPSFYGATCLHKRGGGLAGSSPNRAAACQAASGVRRRGLPQNRTAASSSVPKVVTVFPTSVTYGHRFFPLTSVPHHDFPLQHPPAPRPCSLRMCSAPQQLGRFWTHSREDACLHGRS